MTDLAREVVAGKVPADAGRVAIDAAKWTAGRRAPKVYGDRVQSDTTVSTSDGLAERWRGWRPSRCSRQAVTIRNCC